MACCGRSTQPQPASARRVARPAPAVTSWTVTYPDGSTRVTRNEIAARLLTAVAPGSTYARS